MALPVSQLLGINTLKTNPVHPHLQVCSLLGCAFRSIVREKETCYIGTKVSSCSWAVSNFVIFNHSLLWIWVTDFPLKLRKPTVVCLLHCAAVTPVPVQYRIFRNPRSHGVLGGIAASVMIITLTKSLHNNRGSNAGMDVSITPPLFQLGHVEQECMIRWLFALMHFYLGVLDLTWKHLA